MNRNPVTPEGYKILVEQLRREKSEVRMGIVRDIEEARAHGDISENAEFEDAKERQALCDGRIKLLEGLVASADIIDVNKVPKNGRVVFGTWVDLEDTESGRGRTWRIVGETEGNVEKGKISYKSPVAKALIGRHEGDEVTINTPGGNSSWEILSVRYQE